MKLRLYSLILLCVAALLALSSCQMMVKPEDATLFGTPAAAPVSSPTEITEAPGAVTEIQNMVTDEPFDVPPTSDPDQPGGSYEPGLNG